MTQPLQTPMSEALEKAAIAKLNAETERTKVESVAMQLENAAAGVRLAEAKAAQEYAQHNAEEAKFNAESARIANDLNLRQERYTLAQDSYHHVMNFAAPVEPKSVSTALTQLAVWDRQDPTCDIHIKINSGGGDAIVGLHLFDEITNLSLQGGGKHHITMSVRGQAASMAGILLQAADLRLMGRESWLMIHEISAGTGGKVGEMKDDLKLFEMMCDRIARVFVARAKGNIKLEEFTAKWTDRNWWMDSDQALSYGFVDRIG